MTRNPEELYDEIAQITNQYRSEVSTSRRTWPKSIRDRISELRRLEFSIGEISERTKIAKQTIYSWEKLTAKSGKIGAAKSESKLNGSFLPVGIAKSSDAGPIAREALGVLTVNFPGGIRIEGASPSYLAELFLKMGIGR